MIRRFIRNATLGMYVAMAGFGCGSPTDSGNEDPIYVDTHSDTGFETGYDSGLDSDRHDVRDTGSDLGDVVEEVRRDSGIDTDSGRTDVPVVNSEDLNGNGVCDPEDYNAIDDDGNGIVDDICLVRVVAGTFLRGSHNGDSTTVPEVFIDLNEYFIMSHEVTNALYNICVDAGVCDLPSDLGSYTRDSYFDNPDFANHPVVNIDWTQARTVCVWYLGTEEDLETVQENSTFYGQFSGDLPTEAQREKAARSTDSRTYPWGEAEPNCDTLNYFKRLMDPCVGDTVEVGSYPTGVAFYRNIDPNSGEVTANLWDMSGNVREWVFDRFSPTYYQINIRENPLGPETGTNRIVRDSGFFSETGIRTYERGSGLEPDTNRPDLGVRCVSNISRE